MGKIVFTGDLFAGGDLMSREPSSELIDSEKYWSADQRVVNLENPISNNGTPIDKSNLYCGEEALEYLEEFKIDVAVLSNNHIHDLGDEGIVRTVRLLDDAGIKPVGAGETISEASQPCWLSDDVALFGYCQTDADYLTQVQPATDSQPGVNPLSKRKVRKDLRKLPDKSSCIIYIHWGRENVWFPPSENIKVARELLQEEKVEGIVGTHAHRPQGYISSSNGEKAYFSLGNFLFPNFTIKHRTKLIYPNPNEKPVYRTKGYHRVEHPTYKVWPLANRISLLAELDTDSGDITHHPVLQNRSFPRVSQIEGPYETIVGKKIQMLSKFYSYPEPIREIMILSNKLSASVVDNVRTFRLMATQVGLSETIKATFKRFK